MNKRFIWIIIEILLFVIIGVLPDKKSAASVPGIIPNSSAYQIIDAVNNLRSSRGLKPYTTNAILMQIAQTQADYLASTNGANGHIGPGGTHPIDRAIAAGYPLAGGFISENWVSGSNLDAQGAINYWMGDAPHQLTMLSSDLQDIGAGIGKSGDFYFYVIDCGLATGSTGSTNIQPTSNSGSVIVVSGTPATVEATIPIAIVSTPDAKGNIYHIVQPGQSLWQIALAYKTTVNKIQASNSLQSTDIFAGQKLFIARIGTATPLPPSPTQTRNPASMTPLPTIEFMTPKLTATSTPLPVAPAAGSLGAGTAVFAIVLVAITAAGLVAWVGRSRTI
jgi:LysM repeat protein